MDSPSFADLRLKKKDLNVGLLEWNKMYWDIDGVWNLLAGESGVMQKNFFSVLIRAFYI